MPLYGNAEASEYCDSLKEKGLTDVFRKKTGLIIDAYFSGTKVKSISADVKGAREKAEKGELLFGTIETWLIWKMTKGTVHVTDYSNASRTLLYNINTLEWDKDILKELDIPESMPARCEALQLYLRRNRQQLFRRRNSHWRGSRRSAVRTFRSGVLL